MTSRQEAEPGDLLDVSSAGHFAIQIMITSMCDDTLDSGTRAMSSALLVGTYFSTSVVNRKRHVPRVFIISDLVTR